MTSNNGRTSPSARTTYFHPWGLVLFLVVFSSMASASATAAVLAESSVFGWALPSSWSNAKLGLADLALHFFEILTWYRLLIFVAILLLVAFGAIYLASHLLSYKHSTLRNIGIVWGGIVLLFIAVPLAVGALFYFTKFESPQDLVNFRRTALLCVIILVVFVPLILFMAVFDSGFLQALGQLAGVGLLVGITAVFLSRTVAKQPEMAPIKSFLSQIPEGRNANQRLFLLLQLRAIYSTRETFQDRYAYRNAVRDLQAHKLRLREQYATKNLTQEFQIELQYIRNRDTYLKSLAPKYNPALAE